MLTDAHRYPPIHSVHMTGEIEIESRKCVQEKIIGISFVFNIYIFDEI